MVAVFTISLWGLSACQIAPPATVAAPPTEAATQEPATQVRPTQPPATQPPASAVPEETLEPTEVPTTTEPEGVARLDPLSIPKYVEPLVIPPVMPSEGESDWNGEGELATEYHIAVRQFQQQMLPSDFPMTTVFGYGRAGDPLPGSGEASTFNAPAFTFECGA
jgi:hypothetical protein